MPPKKSKQAAKISGVNHVSGLFSRAGDLHERVVKAIEDTSDDLRDVLLDMCSFVAFLQDDDQAWMALNRNVPELKTTDTGSTHVSKRKAVDMLEAGKRKKKKGPTPREDLDFENQYYQGRNASDPVLTCTNMGCGSCQLITEPFKFISPFEGEMKMEIENCLRVSQPSGMDDWLDAITFLVPFPHIEAIFIRPNSDRSAPSSEATQFIVIPTAMIGASSVQRDQPLPVIFYAPNTKPAAEVLQYPSVKSAGYKNTKSYSGLIQEILTSELKPFNTTIKELPKIPAQKKGKNAATEVFEASLVPKSSPMSADVKAKSQYPTGHLYLTDSGLLFIPQDQVKTVYLPFRSIDSIILLVAKDLASSSSSSTSTTKSTKKASGSSSSSSSKPNKDPEPRNISLLINATEPWYDQEKEDAPVITTRGSPPSIITPNGKEYIDVDGGSSAKKTKKSTTTAKNSNKNKKPNSKAKSDKADSKEPGPPVLINLDQIDVSHLDSLRAYLSTHEKENGLKASYCQATYYDYDAGQIMTGLTPLDE